ncbi:MAG: nitroreductase family protein [Candidatus Heimdallarchaeaceae archaeon]
MLKILQINSEKCIKCENCVKACSVKLFTVHRDTETMEKKVIYEDPYGFCFRCGHCISVCPTSAIEFEGAEAPYTFPEAERPETIISYEDLMKLIRSRRSIRVFKRKAVEKEKIEKILEAMRYAPSASNRQKRAYIVITDQNKIAQLSKEVGSLMKKVKFLLKIKYLLAPFVAPSLRRRLLSKKTKKSLEMFFERTKNGEDLIFFNAPCVIILHAPPYSQMAGPDAGIAFTHGMFTALTLGLGTCWIGYAQEFFVRNKKARKKWGIPSKHNVFGVMIVGYPDIKFLASPPRKALNVKYF